MADIVFVARGDPETSYYDDYSYVCDFALGAALDQEEHHKAGKAYNALHELADMQDWAGDPLTIGTCREASEVIRTRTNSRN